MQIKMKKYLFFGSKVAVDGFFEKAQRIGHFEFISVSGEKPHLLTKPIEDVRLAIRTLMKQPPKKEKLKYSEYDTPNLVEIILAHRSHIETLQEEIRLLSAEIIKVQPIGNFDVEEFHRLAKETKRLFQFFYVRHERLLQHDIPGELIFINREFDFDYYLYIGTKPFVHPAFTEVYVRLPLQDLKDIREDKMRELHDEEEHLRELQVYTDYLKDYLLMEMNSVHLNFAKGDVDYYLEENLFGIEAWVPENKLSYIKVLIQEVPVFAREVAIEKEDIIPTHLENRGFARIGEDLVEAYDTPDPNDPDPSLWIFWSFVVFFGMIVSDAGYGILYLLFLLYLWSKNKTVTGIKKRMLKLGIVLSCSCVIWGVLIASYFSIKLEPNHFLNRISMMYELASHKVAYHKELQDETFKEWLSEYPTITSEMSPSEILQNGHKMRNGRIEYDLMDNINGGLFMQISILVGVIHLTLSFLRNLRRKWAGVGWVLALWGGYFYFSTIVDAVGIFEFMHWLSPSAICIGGQELLYIGLGVAFLLTLIQEKWGIIQIVFKIVEVFSDTLSYLRIYALALASMVLASTFNDLAASAGYFFGVLVLLIGHANNIGLSIMAGTIHGLRLNFLEWYHNCFDGGGKKFNPLRILHRE